MSMSTVSEENFAINHVTVASHMLLCTILSNYSQLLYCKKILSPGNKKTYETFFTCPILVRKHTNTSWSNLSFGDLGEVAMCRTYDDRFHAV